MLRRKAPVWAIAVLLCSPGALAITREEVMARAQPWVDAGVPYCGGVKGGTDYICGGTCNRPSYDGHADWDGYRSDCSGFVSYSWGLPGPGRVTGGFAPFNGEVSFEIDGHDLQPGDALNNSHHIFLFAGWTDQGAGKANVMEELNCDKVATLHEIGLSPSGSTVFSQWHGENYTAIRFVDIQTAPPNAPPQGSLDSADCSGFSGWAQDPDAPDQPIAVHLYVGGPAGSPGAQSFPLTASLHRDDLCGAIGSCNHGFTSAAPLSLLDGAPHEIHAYGIDSAGGNNPEIGARTLACAAAIPAGVRRHVVSGESLAAWKFSTFWQLLQIDDSKLGASAEGPALPASPALIQADGAPEVWLVDGAYRRHVPSPEVAAAWQLDLATVQKKSPAEVDALTPGTPLRPSPFLVKGSGPAVFLLDDPQPAPAASGGQGGQGMAAGAPGEGQGGASGSAGSAGAGKGGASGSPGAGKGGAPAGAGGKASGGKGGAPSVDSGDPVQIGGHSESEGGCSASPRAPGAGWGLALVLALLGLVAWRPKPRAGG